MMHVQRQTQGRVPNENIYFFRRLTIVQGMNRHLLESYFFKIFHNFLSENLQKWDLLSHSSSPLNQVAPSLFSFYYIFIALPVFLVIVAAVNPCASAPCLNGGKCVNRPENDEFYCNCDNTDHRGRFCEGEWFHSVHKTHTFQNWECYQCHCPLQSIRQRVIWPMSALLWLVEMGNDIRMKLFRLGLCEVNCSSGSSGHVREGPRNMKFMRPHSEAIFMTNFYWAGGGGAWPL